MSDTKITELTEDTAPLATDLLVTVHDPGGTPVNRKVTIANVLRFNCGSYTGNGANNRAISVGFQPKVVMVWSSNLSNFGARIDATDGKIITIASTSTVVYLAGPVTGLVLSATGFVTATSGSANTSCNVNAVAYRWEAWG